jgi:hypothetical protein
MRGAAADGRAAANARRLVEEGPAGGWHGSGLARIAARLFRRGLPFRRCLGRRIAAHLQCLFDRGQSCLRRILGISWIFCHFDRASGPY